MHFPKYSGVDNPMSRVCSLHPCVVGMCVAAANEGDNTESILITKKRTLIYDVISINTFTEVQTCGDRIRYLGTI